MIRLLLTLTLPLYLLDQATKLAILARFETPYPGFTDAVEIIPGFFNLVRVHNTGVAFGSFNGGDYSNYIFGAIALAALGFILWLWRAGIIATRLGHLACALLISGILGNLTDRIVHGYVVDFLDFQFFGWHYPSFNVADSCITIAAGLLILDAFLNPNQTSPSTSKGDDTGGSSGSGTGSPAA